MFRSPAGQPGITSWPAGNYVVRVNVTTANSLVDLEAVYVCRVSSTGSNLATVGSVLAISQNLATVGVRSVTVAGAAQVASATDRLAVIVCFKRNSGTAQAIGVTPSELIDVPW